MFMAGFMVINVNIIQVIMVYSLGYKGQICFFHFRLLLGSGFVFCLSFLIRGLMFLLCVCVCV